MRHVLWVVRHFPHTDIPATLLLVNRRAEPAHWEAVRQAWFDALAETPLNTSILWNVASWLIPEDPDGAEQLLQNGERLEPEESRWGADACHGGDCASAQRAFAGKRALGRGSGAP